MKKEKIEELFKEHCDLYCSGREFMDLEHFTQAINQAELEWYKKLGNKLNNIADNGDIDNVLKGFYMYIEETQNKIKELENDR